MADPRFYDNRGPFTLAQICEKACVTLPADVDGAARIEDVASLSGASAAHLAFFSGGVMAAQFAASCAGYCFVPPALPKPPLSKIVLISSISVLHAFASAAAQFYPQWSFSTWAQQTPVDPTAHIGDGAMLSAGVVIGPGAEIGDRVRIGPNAVIGRGVTIGRDCEIGANATITHSYVGDGVLILPGAQIGQPGFGFSSDGMGHVKMPQIGRVILQDRVEIGACTTIDRGALGDTIVGEGTKIDNLVQIGHNTHIGRHCMIVSQVGISGSCELGDFVVLGGQVGMASHVRIGDGARLAARTGVPSGELAGGQDYGGAPAKPMRQFAREIAALSLLAKRRKT